MLSKLLATAVAAVAFSFPAHAEICLLTVNERVHMEGACQFESHGGGDFFVKDRRRNVFVYFSLDGEGQGVAHWNNYGSRGARSARNAQKDRCLLVK